MGNWFRRMREQWTPVERHDPVFGTIRPQRMPDEADSYWEAHEAPPFAPTGESVMTFVDAGEEGPGPEQHEVLRQLEARYATLLPAIAATLLHELRFSTEPRFTSDNLWQHFALSSLHLPRRITPDAEWYLGYESPLDENHEWLVWMRSWTPTHAGMDG